MSIQSNGGIARAKALSPARRRAIARAAAQARWAGPNKPKPRPTRSRRVVFKVTLTVPEGATIADAKDYINEAVGTWYGCLRPAGAYGGHDPGDPMRYLDPNSVRVTKARV